jgi:hypothetical protein
MQTDDPVELIAAQRRRVDERNDLVGGVDSLDALTVLRAIYRSGSVPLSIRMRAAEATLPFERPKLAAVISTNLSEQAFGEALERARKRMDGPQTPLLKAPVTQTDLSGPPMVADRRFRRT